MTAWGTTPGRSVRTECERRGRGAVVAGCVDVLGGVVVDAELLVVLAGPAAVGVLAGAEGGPTGYWPRVWALRGLFHAWDDVAAPAVVAATGDASWRVREMAARVIGRHRVDDGADAVAALQADAVARVRAEAARATAALVTGRS